jgi:hypothetical protein
MPFFTTHLVRPYLQDSPLFTRSNQTHPVCSSSDLRSELHTIPRSHARTRQSGLFGEHRCDGEQRQPSRLLSPLSHYPLQSGRLLLSAPLPASFAAIPFRQAVYFFPLRFPLLLPLSPSVRPSTSSRFAFHIFCRYPLPSVRLRITPLFQSFAGILFVQFVPSLSFHSLCLLPLSPPLSSRHTSPAAVFDPFVAIPSGQVTLYLAYRFWPPLLPLSH